MDEPAPKTIRQRADECRERIATLEDEKAKAATPKERKRVENRIKMFRELEEWFRTRRGYE